MGGGAEEERAGVVVRGGDEGEVRPRAVERARELREPAVGGLRRPVLEQSPRLVRAAIAERVRRIGVAGEEERARGHADASLGVPRHTAAAATSPPPGVTEMSPTVSTRAPSAAPDRHSR